MSSTPLLLQLVYPYSRRQSHPNMTSGTIKPADFWRGEERKRARVLIHVSLCAQSKGPGGWVGFSTVKEIDFLGIYLSIYCNSNPYKK